MRLETLQTLQHMAEYEATFSAQFAIPKEVGEYLSRLVIEHQLERILELGTWRGASAIYLASALQELGRGSITTVNLANEVNNIQQAQDNFVSAGLASYIQQVLQPAEEYLQSASQKKLQFDLIFIDADKTKVDKYVNLSLNLLSPSGYIVVDDWNLLASIQQQFFEVMKQRVDFETERVNIGNGLLVLRRL